MFTKLLNVFDTRKCLHSTVQPVLFSNNGNCNFIHSTLSHSQIEILIELRVGNKRSIIIIRSIYFIFANIFVLDSSRQYKRCAKTINIDKRRWNSAVWSILTVTPKKIVVGELNCHYVHTISQNHEFTLWAQHKFRITFPKKKRRWKLETHFLFKW